MRHFNLNHDLVLKPILSCKESLEHFYFGRFDEIISVPQTFAFSSVNDCQFEVQLVCRGTRKSVACFCVEPHKTEKKSMQFYENKVVFLEKYNIGSDKTSAGCLSKDFM